MAEVPRNTMKSRKWRVTEGTSRDTMKFPTWPKCLGILWNSQHGVLPKERLGILWNSQHGVLPKERLGILWNLYAGTMQGIIQVHFTTAMQYKLAKTMKENQSKQQNINKKHLQNRNNEITNDLARKNRSNQLNSNTAMERYKTGIKK